MPGVHALKPIFIFPGKLTSGSSYVIQLTVTGTDGQYGLAKMQIDVLADITSCSFSLNGQSEYTELDTVRVIIEIIVVIMASQAKVTRFGLDLTLQ